MSLPSDIAHAEIYYTDTFEVLGTLTLRSEGPSWRWSIWDDPDFPGEEPSLRQEGGYAPQGNSADEKLREGLARAWQWLANEFPSPAAVQIRQVY